MRSSRQTIPFLQLNVYLLYTFLAVLSPIESSAIDSVCSRAFADPLRPIKEAVKNGLYEVPSVKNEDLERVFQTRIQPTQMDKKIAGEYSFSGYIINEYLKGTNLPIFEDASAITQIKGIIKHLDAMFSRQPAISENIILYRGVALPESEIPKVGQAISPNKGYFSVSVDSQIAMNYGKRRVSRDRPVTVLYEIKIDKNSPKAIPISLLAPGFGEGELIFPRNLKPAVKEVFQMEDASGKPYALVRISF